MSNMFPPCSVILQISLLSLYNSVHSLYMYISSQFNSVSAKKFLTQWGCNQAKPKICSNPFTLRTACAHGLRTSKGLRSAARKECWTTTLSTLFSCVLSLNPNRLGFQSVSVLIPRREIQYERVDSNSKRIIKLTVITRYGDYGSTIPTLICYASTNPNYAKND